LDYELSRLFDRQNVVFVLVVMVHK
jgi:hypothetical protein